MQNVFCANGENVPKALSCLTHKRFMWKKWHFQLRSSFRHLHRSASICKFIRLLVRLFACTISKAIPTRNSIETTKVNERIIPPAPNSFSITSNTFSRSSPNSMNIQEILLCFSSVTSVLSTGNQTRKSISISPRLQFPISLVHLAVAAFDVDV